MRQLSKITFVNSANIRWDSISLDGNIHLSGTQGVGKSTLLRAILFFYNADKDHLGIRRQGQKRWDEFYLPNNDSYIIYEVSRDDEPAYSVLAFRHNSLTAFRFIDAPFDPDWLLDDGRFVISDHLKIRERLTKKGIRFSSIITTYTRYLDILYGNATDRGDRELVRYALCKSREYGSIPRIIQNVFLNERLDAGFIKETILGSITDETPASLSLINYRHNLANFRDECADIDYWRKTDAKGNLVTQVQAAGLVDTYHNTLAACCELDERCGMLLGAVNSAEAEIPVVQTRMDRLKEKSVKLAEKLESLQENYRKKYDDLTEKEGICSDKIRICREKRREYTAMNIDALIEEDASLPAVRKEEKLLREKILNIEAHFKEITAKYDMAIKSLRFSMGEMEQEFRNILLEAEKENIRQEKDLTEQKNVGLDRVRARHDELLKEILEKRDECSETISNLRDRLASVKAQPLPPEITEAQQRLDSIIAEKRDLENEISHSSARIESLAKDDELERMRILASYRKSEEEFRRKLETLVKEREELSALLAGFKGSFCEWLDSNCPGWENTIGKVADEKKILYNHSLSPAVAEGNDGNLFGISVDLTGVERGFRTPSELKETLSDVEKAIESTRESIRSLIAKRDEEIEAARRKISNEAARISAELKSMKQILLDYPRRIREANEECDNLKKQHEAKIEREAAGINELIKTARKELAVNNQKRQELDGKTEAEIKALKRKFDAEINSRRKALAELRERKETEIAERRADCDSQIAELERNLTSELEGNGVDTAAIESDRKKLRGVEDRIQRIEENKETIINYRRDKKEYLDKEPSFRALQNEIRDKRTRLSERHEAERNQLLAKKKEHDNQLSELSDRLTNLEQGVEQARNFISSDTAPEAFRRVVAIKCSADCSRLITEIYALNTRITNLTGKLKGEVNEFKRGFSKSNTFRFPTELETDKNYLDYAANIDDFITTSKFEDYLTTTNRIYVDVLGRVAADYTNLMERESVVHKVVNAMNSDFARKTFAGVINSIEFRLVPASRAIIQRCAKIKEFWDEYQYELDQNSLFATDSNQKTSAAARRLLHHFVNDLEEEVGVDTLQLSDTFSLQFQVVENGNSTPWTDNMRAVGSEGTDILVKAIINILLINVFKEKVERRSGPFALHCMMDEIGKLADENIQGILQFANERNIRVVNSSPNLHRPLSYSHLYMLFKDENNLTKIEPILSIQH